MVVGATKILQIVNGATKQAWEKFVFRNSVVVEMGIFSDRLT